MKSVYVFLDFLGCGSCILAGLYWYDNRPVSLMCVGLVTASLLARGFVRVRFCSNCGAKKEKQ